MVMLNTFCAGVPAQDYQYDEDYEYDGEDTNYDDEIPKPNQKVPYRMSNLPQSLGFFYVKTARQKYLVYLKL